MASAAEQAAELKRLRSTSSGPDESRTAAAIAKPRPKRKDTVSRGDRARPRVTVDSGNILGQAVPGEAARLRHSTPIVAKLSGAGNVQRGVARTILHAVGGVGETLATTSPIETTGKAMKFVADTAKGASSVAALAPYSAEYNAKRLLGIKTPGDSPEKIAGNIAKTVGEGYSAKYGPSFEGKKGSYRHLQKVIDDEGPLPTVLDLATVAAPGSSGVGKLARLAADARKASGAKPGVIGRVAGERPPLKTDPLKPGTPQKRRKSAIGMLVTTTQDAARAGAQRVAVARSEQRLRSRAVSKPGRVEGRRPSVLNTEPLALSARRATLKPGEVAPLSERIANRRVRLSAATSHARGKAAAAHRVARHAAPLRESFGVLPDELHHAALTAVQLGIRDAAGARAILPLRIAEIERNRAAALADTGSKAHAAERHAAGNEGELKQLRAYVADPSVFDRTDVLVAVGAASKRVVGSREGLSAERAAAGRSALVGETLGVKTAKQLNAEAVAARDAAKAAARTKIKAATVKRDKARASGARVLSAARADVAKAQGRAEVLSRNVGGGGKAGGLGVRQAKNDLARTQSAVDAALGRAHAELVAARQEHKAANAPPIKHSETAAQHEARVAQAAKELHPSLVAPEYVPSKFEREGLQVSRTAAAPSNPLAKRRAGTLYQLGREDKTHGIVEANLASNLRRGASLEAESAVLGKHGIAFRSPEEANRFAAGLGLNADPARGRVDVALHQPGLAAKGLVKPTPTKRFGPRPSKGSDLGDYDKTRDVFLLPTAVKSELDALGLQAATPTSILQRLSHYPQAALLALRPSWWQFQRVNDLVAAAASGSLLNTPQLAAAIKQLGPDSREVLHTFSGDSISAEMLRPSNIQRLGRLQRILDENPTYRDALNSDKPATALLVRAGKNLPTVLLRSDKAITAGFRERQLLHNLIQIAKTMDPDVAAIAKAYRPIGHAFKTADLELATKLLTDKHYTAQLEDAAQRLYKVHGDWHNYTAREQRFKHFAAFYGFLRFATKMALYTLPVNHPYVAGILAQLGAGGASYAKFIIGPDQPYGLGALYNSDGTIAADFTRANPLLGPLFQISKPEQTFGLLTPLAGIALNYFAGQPLALSDSSSGYVKQYTVRGDPNRHDIGSYLGDPHVRIALDQTLGMLAPYSEWKRFDSRQQSSDSLAFDRRIMRSESTPTLLKLDAKNAAAQGGVSGLAYNLAPLAFPGSARNLKTQGEIIAVAKKTARDSAELKAAKRNYTLNTAQGQVKQQLDALKMLREQGRKSPQADELKRQLALLRAARGH